MNRKLYPLLLLVIGAAHTLQASDNEQTTGGAGSPHASKHTRQVVDTMEMEPLTDPFLASDCGQALARLKELKLDLSKLVLYQTLGKKNGGYLFTPMTVTSITYKEVSEEDMPRNAKNAFPRDESK